MSLLSPDQGGHPLSAGSLVCFGVGWKGCLLLCRFAAGLIPTQLWAAQARNVVGTDWNKINSGNWW